MDGVVDDKRGFKCSQRDKEGNNLDTTVPLHSHCSCLPFQATHIAQVKPHTGTGRMVHESRPWP